MSRRRGQVPVKGMIGVAVLFALAAGGVLAYLRLSSPRLTVSEAVQGPVVQAFYSTGTIQPQRDYPIKSNVAGIITKLLVDKGDRVKSGQPLATVSDPQLEYEVNRAAADVEEKARRADEKSSPVLAEYDARVSAAKSMLEIADRDEQRIKSLIEHSAAAQQDLDVASNRLEAVKGDFEAFKAQRAAKLLELRRDLTVAQSALDTARWNQSQQTLKSPIDGVVLDRPLSLGTRLAINDQLMTVADIAPAKLVMRAAVDEEDIVKTHPDQVVHMTLYSYADRAFEGRVAKIYDRADSERRTFEVDVKLVQPDDRLSPGMTGELAFETGKRDKAVVIPTQAVQKDGSVWMLRDGKVYKASVKLGLRGIERTEVVSGIKPGDRIVISAAEGLSDGENVRTTLIDPITAAGLNQPRAANDGFKGFR